VHDGHDRRKGVLNPSRFLDLRTSTVRGERRQDRRNRPIESGQWTLESSSTAPFSLPLVLDPASSYPDVFRAPFRAGIFAYAQSETAGTCIADRRRPQGRVSHGDRTSGQQGPQGHASLGDRTGKFVLIADRPVDNPGGSRSKSKKQSHATHAANDRTPQPQLPRRDIRLAPY
jgi:hypothetical protein